MDNGVVLFVVVLFSACLLGICYARCALRIACCVLRVVYCVLCIACCILRIGYCVLRIAYCVSCYPYKGGKNTVRSGVRFSKKSRSKYRSRMLLLVCIKDL